METRYQEGNQGQTWDSPRRLPSQTLNLAAWASGGQSPPSLQTCLATSWFNLTLCSRSPPSAALVLHAEHSTISKGGGGHLSEIWVKGERVLGRGGLAARGQAPQPFQDLCSPELALPEHSLPHSGAESVVPLTLTSSLTDEMETHLLALHPTGEALVPSARVRVTYTHMPMHRGALRCRSPAGVPQAWGCEDRAIRADTSRLDRNAPLPASASRPARLCQSDPKPL